MVVLTHSEDVNHQQWRQNFKICHKKSSSVQISSLFRHLENGGHIEFLAHLS
jgi:hypothetical protein